MDSAAEMIVAMRLKGVRIWSDNGQLRYQSSKGALTEDDIGRLRALKAEILAFIERTPPMTEPKLRPRSFGEKVPLTFSQESWCNLFALPKRHSTRSVFTALRLAGHLNVDSLGKSLCELVHRHESLRTTIVMTGGAREQCIGDGQKYELEVIDLSGMPEAEREAQAIRLTLELVTEWVDVCVGPLFAAKLMRLGANEHVLAIAMDHLISDAASMGILLRELWTLYGQSQRGLPLRLPEVAVQFGDYAVWQRKSGLFWSDKHDTYWRGRLAAARHTRLFANDKMVEGASSKLASWPIGFGETLSVGLRELSRQERTTLVMTVLCAYAASVFALCGTTDLVVPFATVGRLHPQLEHVIGFLACPLFLRIELLEDDSFVDLLTRITKEYRTAYEHHDSGRIVAQVPRPEFMGNAVFNWYPREFQVHPTAFTALGGNRALADSGIPISLQPFVVENPLAADAGNEVEWGSEATLLLSDCEVGITGSLVYRTDHASDDEVRRFERNLLFFAQRLLREPQSRVDAKIPGGDGITTQD